MNHTPEFRCLERTTFVIARHTDYPGKRAVVQECLEEIDEHFSRGRLTDEQRARLVAILSTEGVPAWPG